MGGGFTSWGLAVPGNHGSGGHPVEDRMSAPRWGGKAVVQVDMKQGQLVRSHVPTVRSGCERVERGPAAVPGVAVPKRVPSGWSGPDRREHGISDLGTPMFAAPALMVVAAVAILQGYYWLHLFPEPSFRSTSSMLFVVCVVPATVLLTRHVHGPRWIPAGRVARAAAMVVLVLGSVAAFHHTPMLDRVLGVVSLVLAASLVSLVAASERRRQSPTRTD